MKRWCRNKGFKFSQVSSPQKPASCLPQASAFFFKTRSIFPGEILFSIIVPAQAESKTDLLSFINTNFIIQDQADLCFPLENRNHGSHCYPLLPAYQPLCQVVSLYYVTLSSPQLYKVGSCAYFFVLQVSSLRLVQDLSRSANAQTGIRGRFKVLTHSAPTYRIL